MNVRQQHAEEEEEEEEGGVAEEEENVDDVAGKDDDNDELSSVVEFEDEGEFVILGEDEYEDERRREKLVLKDRARRVREPHRRRKMVLAEPCIPWEYGSNKHDSQKGTGGFGRIRNATTRVHSSTELPADDPTAVPKWNLSNGFATQAGQTPFGAIREQVTKVVEHEGEMKKCCQELLLDQTQTERTLKLWAQSNPEAKNQKLFGCKRPVVSRSVGGRAWTKEELAKSRASMPRLCRVNETSAAQDGRSALGGMVTGYQPSRQATMEVNGLYRTAEDQLESNKFQSWLGGQLLMQNQSKTNGFCAPRDVVNTSYYARVMSEHGGELLAAARRAELLRQKQQEQQQQQQKEADGI